MRSILAYVKAKVLGLALVALASVAGAQTSGTWNTDAGIGNLNWSNASNWLDGNIADGVGATANFTFDITAARTVTLDGAGSAGTRTLGVLNVGDPILSSGGPHNYTIARANANVLNMDNTGSTAAQINLLSNSTSGLAMSTPLNLLDNLIVNNNSASSNLTMSAGLTGNGNVTLNANGTGTITLSTTTPTMVGTITNAGTGTGTVTISAVLGVGPTGIIQNSATSQLTLSGANTTYTGGVTLNAGILSLGNAAALGATASTLTINGGRIVGTASVANANAMNWNGNFEYSGGSLNLGTGAVTLAGARTVTNLSTGTLTVGGTVGGTGSIVLALNSTGGFTFTSAVNNAGSLATTGIGTGTTTFSGGIGANITSVTQNTLGTMVLNGANSYTGPTTLAAGILNVDFTGVGAPATNAINAASTLNLSGGTTFNVIGAANNTQTFNGAAFNAGAVTMNANNTTSAVLVNLGAITRSTGATANFSQTTGAPSATTGFTTSTANTNGILGGWATFGGTDWATNNGTNIAALDAGSYTTNTWASGTHTTVAATNTVGASSTTNTLRFSGLTAGVALTLSGTNTIESGGILFAAGAGAHNVSMTGGTIRSGINELIVHQYFTGGTLTINSAIADNTGATTVVKSGGGAVTLGGTNTFTGGLIVNGTGSGGILTANSDAALGAVGGDIRLANFAQLAFGATTIMGPGRDITLQNSGRLAGNVVVGGNISGNGGLTMTGGTLYLAGNNTFTGGTNLPSATGGARLIVASNANLGDNSSTLTMQNTSNSLTIIGTEMTSFGTRPASFGSGNSSTFTLEIQDAANTFLFDRPFVHSINSETTLSTLAKVGRGNLEVTAAVSFQNSSGSGFGVNGGTVLINTPQGGSMSVNRFGYGGGTLHLLGRTNAATTLTTTGIHRLDTGGSTIIVDNNNGSSTTTYDIGTINSSRTVTGSSINLRTINHGTGSAVILTDQTNTNGILAGGRMTFNGIDFATNTTDAANGPVGSISYSGGQLAFGDQVASSTVNYLVSGSATASGGAANGNTFKFVSSAPGQSASLANLQMTITSGGLLFVGDEHYSITDGAIRSANAATADLIVHTYGAGDLTIGAVIQNNTGASTLTKAGTGTLILTGTNTYTGQTYINGGVVRVTANNNLGGTAAVNLNGGTLQFDTAFATTRTFSLGGNGGTISIAPSQVQTLSGVVSGANGQLTLTNTGTLVLTGTNTFGGGVVINSGTLRLGSNGAINSGGINSVQINGSGRLHMNGFNANIAALQSASASSIVENDAVGNVTLNVYNGGANTFAGVIQNGAAAGVLSLTKSGGGTLTLSNTNTYTGTTTVNNGLLRVNGSLSGSSAVTVAHSGSLGGTGTVGGVIIAGGTLAPGSSVGTLNAGSLTFSGGSLAVELNTSSNTADQVISSGPVDLGLGVASLELSILGGVSGSYNQTFTLISNTALTDTTTGHFAGMVPTGDTYTFSNGTGLEYVINYAGGSNGNDVTIQFTSVPEPAGLSMLTLAGALLVKRRQRQGNR